MSNSSLAPRSTAGVATTTRAMWVTDHLRWTPDNAFSTHGPANGDFSYAAPERMVATLCRTSGTSSSSNHLFFFSQMLFRGLG